MKTSSVAQAAFLLALTAQTGSATKYLTTVKNFNVKFKLSWWDDGRADPYRMAFTKWGIYSAYTFNASGQLQTITVEGEEQLFPASIKASDGISDVGSRKLLAIQEGMEADQMEYKEEHYRRRLYDCSDCEKTWDTICDTGLDDVCAVLAWGGLTGDAETAVILFCNKFTRECDAASGEETCAEDCTEECDPNPCENGGECSVDGAGGHLCSCPSGYGGMSCQTDISSLNPFYIEVDYLGTWTLARQAVFQTAANRWSEVITHVPCGGNEDNPAGRLLISATLEGIDGNGGTLGSAGPTSVWNACNTVSLQGAMTFDIDDIEDMEDAGTFEGVIQHEMGHVIGLGTLWGTGYGDCTTCYDDSNPAWTCPAALSAYYDIGGSDANILELDGGSGTTCGHLDEGIFDDELMTGYVDSVMHLSKMTAAILDDLDYIVDASAVDSYTLPPEIGASISGDEGPSISVNDTAVETTILLVDEDGALVRKKGIIMVF